MQRKDLDEHVEDAVSCPVLSNRVKNVVEDIAECVPNEKTREMMYELVDIVLQMGQRVRALEKQMAFSSVQEELSRREARMPSRRINYATDFPKSEEQAEHR